MNPIVMLRRTQFSRYLQLMTHQIRRLIEALLANVTFVGSLVRVSENVIPQIS